MECTKTERQNEANEDTNQVVYMTARGGHRVRVMLHVLGDDMKDSDDICGLGRRCARSCWTSSRATTLANSGVIFCEGGAVSGPRYGGDGRRRKAES